MKKCKLCNEFDVKSYRSYTSHLGKMHDGVDIVNVDLEYTQECWPFLSKGKRRNLLLREANYACSECGFDKKRSCGGVILEIDHIDGDSRNNSRENLRVLCPNCHALTETFRNWQNKGNKKTSSRIRKGNVLHEQHIAAVMSAREVQRQFEDCFIAKVQELHETGEIDFTKFGWVQKLCAYFGESPQVTGRRLRRLMPAFYLDHCHKRTRKYRKTLESLSG